MDFFAEMAFYAMATTNVTTHAVLRFCADVIIASALIMGFGIYSVFMGSALVQVGTVVGRWFQIV